MRNDLKIGDLKNKQARRRRKQFNLIIKVEVIFGSVA